MLGYSKLDLDRKLSGGFSPDYGSLYKPVSGSEGSVFFGLGIKYKLNHRFAARLQWTGSNSNELQIKTIRLSLEMSL